MIVINSCKSIIWIPEMNEWMSNSKYESKINDFLRWAELELRGEVNTSAIYDDIYNTIFK